MKKMLLIFMVASILSSCSKFNDLYLSNLLAKFDRETQHEYPPYGVPENWSWAQHSSDDEWTHLDPLYGETRSNFWIEVFPYDAPVYPENIRVAVRNNTYLALFEGETEWRVIQQWDELMGKYYSYKYDKEIASINSIRFEQDGSYSFKLKEGANAHLWPTQGSVHIDQYGKLLAVVYVCQARLILDDPEGPDNRDNAKFVFASGVDWKMPDGSGPEEISYCDAIHHGRYVKLTKDWRFVITSSMTSEERELYPLPPIEYFRFE